MGCRVQGVGCRVQGVGCRVQGVGLTSSSTSPSARLGPSGPSFSGLRFRVGGLGFSDWAVGSGFLGLGFEVYGLWWMAYDL